jgi:UDP-glucuronate 4-epimerase
VKDVLITGAAGFIGSALTTRLLAAGHRVYGLDSFTPFYDPTLKKKRLERYRDHPNFRFQEMRLADLKPGSEWLKELSTDFSIVHLAAQPGVQASLEEPGISIDENIKGTFSVLEFCRIKKPCQLILGSSSSVYGSVSGDQPCAETHSTDFPLSIYAATKKSAEVLAHSYSACFSIPVTVLRFFTVYGPWGRPDMAVFRFAEALWQGLPIELYQKGEVKRDFTFIDDVTEGIYRVLNQKTPQLPFRVFNLGRSRPQSMQSLIDGLEKLFSKKAIVCRKPSAAGDPEVTWSDSSAFLREFQFQASTDLDEGLSIFFKWFVSYKNRLEAVSLDVESIANSQLDLVPEL